MLNLRHHWVLAAIHLARLYLVELRLARGQILRRQALFLLNGQRVCPFLAKGRLLARSTSHSPLLRVLCQIFDPGARAS